MLSLTKGSIDQILRGKQIVDPIVQIMNIVKVPSQINSDNYHYRLEISDGDLTYPFTKLSKKFKHLVENNTIDVSAIIKLNEYFMLESDIANERAVDIIIILGINILMKGDQVQLTIGEPKKQVGSLITKPVKPSLLKPPKKNIVVQKKARPSTKLAKNEKKTSNPLITDWLFSEEKLEQEKNLAILNDRTLVQISSLTTSSKNWKIRAKVTHKAPIYIWSTPSSSGPMFSMNLWDESGPIRYRMYNKKVDEYYNKIQEGQTYYFSSAEVCKITDRRNNTTNHLYDLISTQNSIIAICDDNEKEKEKDLPINKMYNFKSLGNIINLVGVNKDDFVDVLCVIKNIEEVKEVVSRKNPQSKLYKRDVILIDKKMDEITYTMWNKQAHDFKANIGDIIAIKNTKVGEYYQEITLSGSRNSVVNPDIPEAESLRKWYETDNNTFGESRPFLKAYGFGCGMRAPWYSLRTIINKSRKSTDFPETFICKAKLNFMANQNIITKTCPSPGTCFTEVVEKNNKYTCKTCEIDWDTYKPRLSAKLTVSDWSSVIHTVAHDDVVGKILGLSAVEVEQLQRNDKNKLVKKIADASFKSYQLKMRMINKQKDARSSVPDVYSSILDVSPIDSKIYNNHLLEHLKTLQQKN